MKSASLSKITAELSACEYRVNMSLHARQRAVERSSIAPGRVLDLVTTRHTVTLPFRDAARSYHVFFDKVKMDFMVAVVAIDGGIKGNSASIVTILTRSQFENDAGSIGKKALRTAASRALDPVDFRRWEAGEFGPGGVHRRYRVFTYYKNEDGNTECEIFNNAPVCDQFVDEHSLTSAAGHPGFWSWYARQASRTSLPVDSVVSMRIADTDKVRLDLCAPARECLSCEAKKPGWAFSSLVRS
ncbi:hypothetical protein C7401_15434 [Paraburkholderia unamae]|uniref:hypothetical protein n=1 Tax=Paraburkholderia unamae TaxID=219649 RepID=UPI000DC2CE98|nr:hypothetical protein [Paraburkholderia unamae]RAR47993.1 hypothetical protein C7401_15434 [Paraburkholderia unamae]